MNFRRFLFLVLISFVLTFDLNRIETSPFSSNLLTGKVNAQTLPPETIATIIYQQIPDIPLENNYTSKQTGNQAPENTLVSRLVRYHQFVKARPTTFRLDWKLTLADYLGINERMIDNRYPGFSTLNTSPMLRDQEAIQTLSRSQREKLVEILVSIYNSKSKPGNSTNPPQSTQKGENNTPPNNSSSPTFVLPQPGAAELLK